MKLITTFLALAATAQMAWAANGSLLHGLGPASTAQGGTGVSSNSGTIDAIHKNAATIGAQSYGEGKVNAELFLNVFKQGPKSDTGTGSVDSKSGVSIMPSVGASYKINDDWAFGAGIMTYGGGVADFSGLATHSGVQTKHMLIKLQPGVSYRANDWLTIGAAPIFNYSTLVTNVLESGVQSTRSADAQFGIGGQVGVALKPAKGLDIGITYQTRSKLPFKSLIDWGKLTTGTSTGLSPITVTQPTELAAGISYAVTEAWRFAFDWRYLGWRGAAGYGDLGWADQNVFAVGTQYQLDKLALRAGFNYSKSPIESRAGTNGLANYNFQGTPLPTVLIDRLNMIAFPAMGQSHITVGAGYAVSPGFDLDLAFMYMPEVTIVRSGTTLVAPPATLGPYTLTTKLTQWSVTAGATYRF